MKLTIVAVGHKPPAWIAEGCAEYVKRMPRDLPLAVVEVRPEPRAGKNRQQLLAAEKERLQLALQAYPRIVLLDERGSDLTTRQLADRLDVWRGAGGDTAFVIGGADGVDPALKQQAAETLRLSSLTLPHMLARLLVCEQLYRAYSLLRNHPYHREG
ncbi:MAG TPA: 23S rRNA (pseudouridine(1915)-N(3))-methyltransferase RlmH [Accumulibacter sp.]|nr:23S rRNA (pseudouridine(1915)-N(3))-methyltransferase RlmH [Accumulibacter sp.]HMW16211.1 23S rRNA (pseudouridine(1915)-N(3))-methyltransferase RlmH [Accumulibacter sp.]HMX21438.1 23S rRNA (pseudouridine(1915)-N(3))-methyltransferase RlmH [Accumulibacter sp.]HNC16722.1 23S rRNA (pseudouridine(1915)-N(3))-methyltransferase RlmH [Accumulibacter sp.]HND79592.1 23S rRNA (pseudouridine(1915)-N(3))-methyltransferase RlmH [Accumulibacter sp.]